MSKRKPNNPRKRVEVSSKAILRSNHIAVVNVDPSGRQGMVNWKTAKNIPPGRQVATAICDIAHRWTIYFAGLCVDGNGDRYMKSSEVAPQGLYMAHHLEDVIESFYRELLDTCNKSQLVASGWIALPYEAELTEEQAFAVFEAVGAWNEKREAA